MGLYAIFCISLINSTGGTHSARVLAASWPMDPHFPLPGSIGIDYKQFAEEVSHAEPNAPRKTLANAFLELEPENVRKQILLDRFLNEKFEEDIKQASKVTTTYQRIVPVFLCVLLLPK